MFLAQLTDFFSDDIRSTLIWKIFSMWFLISVYKCKKVQRAAQRLKKTQVQKMTILHYLSFEGGREGDGEGIIRGQKIDWAGSQAQIGGNLWHKSKLR